MHVIGLVGRAAVGKDTVADYLCDRRGFTRYALSAPIKKMLGVAFGWTPDQWDDRDWKESINTALGFSPRRAAQTLGMEWGRALNPELWLMVAKVRARDALLSNSPGFVITDIRFENEVAWVREVGGYLIHIERPGVELVESHPSEAGVITTHDDFLIINDGPLALLYHNVERILKIIRRNS